MAFKQIIAIIIAFIFLVTFVYPAKCDSEFYLYNFKYSKGNVEFLGKTLEVGCLPGNVQDEFYKFNIIKDNKVIYSYWFDPTKRFSDVIDKDGNINGGLEIVEESTFSIPTPIISELDYDMFEILNDKNINIVTITKEQEKEKTIVEPFSLFDWVNNLLKATLENLFS